MREEPEQRVLWSEGPMAMLRALALALSKMAEKAMAPHSSTLAWKIPWTEEPGRL